MAVGSLEPQFYAQLMEGLGLSNENYIEQFSDFDEGKKRLKDIFVTKTQSEWTNIFDKSVYKSQIMHKYSWWSLFNL